MHQSRSCTVSDSPTGSSCMSQSAGKDKPIMGKPHHQSPMFAQAIHVPPEIWYRNLVIYHPTYHQADKLQSGCRSPQAFIETFSESFREKYCLRVLSKKRWRQLQSTDPLSTKPPKDSALYSAVVNESFQKCSRFESCLIPAMELPAVTIHTFDLFQSRMHSHAQRCVHALCRTRPQVEE